jgi:hypothetical protein
MILFCKNQKKKKSNQFDFVNFEWTSLLCPARVGGWDDKVLGQPADPSEVRFE